MLVRHTKTLAETLGQLQELRPDYLIIEDLADEFRAVDAILRIAHTMPSLKLSVLLFVEADTQPVEQLKNVPFDLAYLAKSGDFGELKRVLVVNQDSSKSALE